MAERASMVQSRDVYAGLFFCAVGAFFVIEALLRLNIGTAHRMGPGFFPVALGAILIAMGLAIALGKAATNTDVGPIAPLRGVLLLASAPLLFGLLIDRFGFLPATFAAVFVASIADRETRFGQAVIVAACITAFCTLVFIYGLNMPYRLIKI